MQPDQGAAPYTPQQPVITGSPVSVGMGNPVAGMYVPTTNALVALILACASFVFGGICLSIPAVILAARALEITRSIPNNPDHGTAKAAQIVGWINIGLTVLVLVLLTGAFALDPSYG